MGHQTTSGPRIGQGLKMDQRMHRIFLLFLLAGLPLVKGQSQFIRIEEYPTAAVTVDPAQKTISFAEDFTNDAESVRPVLAKIFGQGTVRIQGMTPENLNIKLTEVGGEQLITLEQAIDHENTAICGSLIANYDCQITLFVVDDTSSIPAFVYINVADVNDNDPVLTSPDTCKSPSVDENNARSGLCTFTASDPDRGVDRTGLQFILTALGAENIFTINQDTGVLDASNLANYEEKTVHSLTVDVVDNDGHRSGNPYNFFVSVNDQPDQPPIFQRLELVHSPLENMPVGDLITQVVAIDGDRGVQSKIKYEMTVVNGQNENGQDYFTINPDDGSITVAQSLDTTAMVNHRGTLNFQVTVTAIEQDSVGQTTPEDISITVVDTNDKQVTLSSPPTETAIEIPEIYTGELTGTRFEVNDADTNPAYKQYTARLTDRSGAPLDQYVLDAIELSPSQRVYTEQTQFYLSIQDGAIDYDRTDQWRNQIEFQVFFEQAGKTPLAIPFTIKISDVNDEEPEWQFQSGQTAFRAEVEENTPVGEPVITLAATDDDFTPAFNTRRYDFDSRKPDYLAINQDTGDITIAGKLDYELIKSETIRVKVWDNPSGQPTEQNTQFADLTIVVTPLNDEKPTIVLSESSISIEEHTQDTQLSVTITVADRDDDNNLECSLQVVNSNPPPGVDSWFFIEPDCSSGSAVIERIGDIEREINDQIFNRVDLVITVKDLNTSPDYVANFGSASVPLAIDIEDVNDNPPVIEIDGNDLRILEKPIGTDEETAQRRKVTDIYATDVDYDTEFCFEIEQSEFSDWFEIDETTRCSKRGQNLIRRKLGEVDRESDLFLDPQNPVLELTIVVSDTDGVHRVPKTISIRVEDRNDEQPTWSPVPILEYEIDENDGGLCLDPEGEIDLAVGIHATDADECSDFSKFGCITFVLENGLNRFEIMNTDSYTARLYNKGCGIDRETDQTFEVTIFGYDDYREGAPTQNGNNRIDHRLTIIVKDINDNAPEFVDPKPSDPTVQVGSFDENDTEDKDVIFHIQDKDVGENATIVPKITGITCARSDGPCGTWDEDEISRGDGPFLIGTQSTNSTWLTINTRSSFNFTDRYGVYSISLHLEDQGVEKQETDATFNIEIADVNNNHPTIDQEDLNGLRFICQEADTGIDFPVVGKSSVIDLPSRFTATDKDDPQTPNGQTYLEIFEPDVYVQEYLRIDQDSGALYWRQPWVYDENGVKLFNVKLVAKDKAGRNSDVMEITIRMRPGKEQPPFFKVPSVTMQFEENEEGEIDTFVEADDSNIIGDDTDYQEIYYYIVGSTDAVLEHFELNGTTLKIKDGKPLDREAINHFEIIVLASNEERPDDLVDSIPPNNPSYLQILLEVLDQNDEPPRFNVPNNIISAGISTALDVGNKLMPSYWINATDLDTGLAIGDMVTYKILGDIKTDSPTLQTVMNATQNKPFYLEANGTAADLFIDFKPQPAHEGYFSFMIQACDSVGCEAGHMGTVECKIYIVTDDHFISILFNNNNTFVEEKAPRVQEILSRSFGFMCVIDKIELTRDDSSGAVGASTTMTVHFINERQDSPKLKVEFENWAVANPDEYSNLVTQLAAESLSYDVDERAAADNGPSDDQITIYALAGICAVLAVCFLILGTSCFFRNRSMQRKVRALGAGGTTSNNFVDTPGGGVKSNPLADDEMDKSNLPDFDAQSTTSGASSLAGVEEQDDFNGIKDNQNPDFEDEFNSSGDEENVYGSVRNPAYEPEYQAKSEAGNYEYPTAPQPIETSGSQDFNPLGTVSRRNPLANMVIETE